MRGLAWWFRLVGVLYVLLGVGFVPALNAARLRTALPGFDAPVGGVAYRALLDFTFMFGLELMVVGAFLLHASRDPLRNVPVLWLVVALEVVRGIADDLYMIVRGYPAPLYTGFIVLHLVVIGTGIAALRSARAAGA